MNEKVLTVLKSYLSGKMETKSKVRVVRNINKIIVCLFNIRTTIKICKKKFVFFPQVELVLTTRCTMRCEECLNLMQYYKKPRDMELNDNIDYIRMFMNAVDGVDRFILLGGEPFLYKDLAKIIKELESYSSKIRSIWIYTNGTVMPADQELQEVLSNNKKIYIYISNYGDLSKKKKELEQFCISKGINYIMADEDAYWISAGDLNNRGRNDEYLKMQYQKCTSKCTSILGGYLSYCARSSSARDLGIVSNERNVNLLEDNLRRNLTDFLYLNVDFLQACNFCDRGTGLERRIPKALQKA